MKLKSVDVGGVVIKNNIASAPMAGFSDAAFRTLCVKLGAGLCVTEMVSAKGLIYKNEHTQDLLVLNSSENNGGAVTSAQLFGNDPAIMRAACESEALAPYKIIDINMGCPVPKIYNNGEGSALLNDPSLACKIINECAKSGKIITAKFRVGISDNRLIAPLFAKACEDGGAKLLTIHGRTREAMYSGEINYEQIAKAKAAVKIPVFANGGIFSVADADVMLEKTGADGVAIARGGVNNPLLYAELAGEKNNFGLKDCAFFVMDERLKVMPDRIVAHGMRKFLSQILKGVRGAKEVKLAIFEAESCAEIKNILNSVL